MKLSFVLSDKCPAGWAVVGHVSVGVAAEEEGGARPAPTEAAEQADHPAGARDILVDICGDLEQD